MRAVFLDTVGMLAIWERADQWHSAAERAFANLLQNNISLVTTSFVLIECGNAAARRPYRDKVLGLRAQLIDDALIFDPTLDEAEDAWKAFGRGNPGDAGIVDHISFVIMRRLGIHQAFTNDRHFTGAGFETLF